MLEREKETTDPIELRREQAKDKKRMQQELAKLLGDAKSLEEEIDEYMKQIEEQEEELNRIERAIDTDKLETADRRRLTDAKEQIDFAKNTIYKAKNKIIRLKIKIEKSDGFYEEILRLKLELNQIIDDYFVKIAEPWNVRMYGEIHSTIFNMPEANNFLKIAIDKKNYNSDYVRKNGKLYHSIDDLGNDNLSKDIKLRIAKESNQKDCKVVVFNPSSSIAKKIEESYALKEFLSKNIELLQRNKALPNTTIEFTNIDKDLYSTFHGAEIKNIFFDSEKNLNLRIEDYYNFNPNRTSIKGRVGEKLQKQGGLEPYYSITVLKIPKEVWIKYAN